MSFAREPVDTTLTTLARFGLSEKCSPTTLVGERIIRVVAEKPALRWLVSGCRLMYQRKQRIMLLPARCLLPSCSLAHLTNSAHITHLTSFFEFAFSIFSLPSFYTPLFLDIRLSTGFKRLFSRDFSRFVRFLQLVFLFFLSLSFYSQSLSLLICLVRSNFCFNQDDSLRV